MLHLRNLAALMSIAVFLASCGSHSSDSSPSVVPQTVSTGTNLGNGSISTPPAPAPRISKSTLSRMDTTRSTKSVSLVGCPSSAICVLQGQSVTLAGQSWWACACSLYANGLFTTSFSPIQGVTYTINPNPVHPNPVTYSVTFNASLSAPIGLQNVTISETNDYGAASGSFPWWPFYICSSTTGSCGVASPAPSATPSTTPSKIPPPPPIPGKATYTADRTAHVIIPLTDANAASEALTWNVSGFPNTFTNVKFIWNTTSSPSISFDVGVDTIPQNYPLSLTVTSAATGLVSSASTVNVNVPHVVGYYTIVNSSNLYETNAAHQVIVSDGSQYVSTGPTVIADFPGTGGGVATASIMRARQSSSSSLPSGFNVNGTDPECLASGGLIGAQDGKTPAKINIAVTCVRASVVSVDLATKSSVVNNYDELLTDLATQTVPCQNPVTSGIVFTCSTGAVALQHYTNQATGVTLSAHLNVYNDVLPEVQNEPLYFTLNAKGAPYPKTAFDGGNGTVVPFPAITSPLVNCPSASRGTATCPQSVANTFRGNTINYYANQGWIVPAGISIKASGPTYQAHHILPSGCGGGDAMGNGVFLTQLQHTPFTNWWLAVPPCATNNVNN